MNLASYTKFLYWFKTLSKFISVQIVVQALGFASGILLVRILDQKQYAYYTIALAMQTTMLLLGDLGISVGLSAIGGKVWQDKNRFGQLINTALYLQRYLAGISFFVVTPILVWTLLKNGASIIDTVLLTVAVLTGLNFQLTNTVLSLVPRLHSQIGRIQNLDLISIASKLTLLGVFCMTFINATMAMVASSIATGLQRLVLAYWITDTIDIKAPTNEKDKKFILSKVKQLAPSGIFFCMQGQIGVLLLTIFGDTQKVAEAGALGRISIIFMLINSVMANIILPSFTRCQSITTLRRRYFQILGFYTILGLVMIGIAASFPGLILWILGDKYSNLEHELLFLMISTAFGAIVSAMSSLNLSKAWVDYVWIEIPLRIVIQIILLLNIDVSTVIGVLIFGMISSISPFLVNAFLTYRGFKELAKTVYT